MKRWFALFSILGLAAVGLILFHYWCNEAERRYARIQGGMTRAEVEAVMGACETVGLENPQTWSFRCWDREMMSASFSVEVRFGDDGRVVEKCLVKFHDDVPHLSVILRQRFSAPAVPMKSVRATGAKNE